MDLSFIDLALPLGLFGGAILLIMMGYPVAFTLPGTAILFALLGWSLDRFDLSYLSALPMRYWGTITNDILIAIPLFVFMGVMLERSRIAEALLDTLGRLFGRLRGGLGLSTILVAAMLAASTGIVGATVITMGLISLPAMLKAGYDKRLATGLICASGSLAQVIPPSTLLVFLAVILQSAYSRAQMAQGNFAPETLSVGEIFAGAFLPGIMIALAYAVWVALVAFVRPAAAPAITGADGDEIRLFKRIINHLVPALLLIGAVLGSIIAGIATPTESAAVGAVGAIVLAMIKHLGDHFLRDLDATKAENRLFVFWMGFVGLLIGLGLTVGGVGVLSLLLVVLLAGAIAILWVGSLRQTFIATMEGVSISTLIITCMVFTLFLGASVFSLVFARLGGEELVADFLAAMPGGEMGAVVVVLLVMFLLGFFLDPFEIIFIVVPIAAPVLLMMGVEPIWLAILVGIVLQTSYVTPPFGFSLFFLRSVAPPQIATIDIYRGIVPFVGLQLLCLLVVWFYPQLATWLPNLIYG
jgi:TRAP-type mannitol/chloroaromatic compound transport system permease large subunit